MRFAARVASKRLFLAVRGAAEGGAFIAVFFGGLSGQGRTLSTAMAIENAGIVRRAATMPLFRLTGKAPVKITQPKALPDLAGHFRFGCSSHG